MKDQNKDIPQGEKYKHVIISKIQGFEDMYFTTSFKEDGTSCVAIHLVAEDRKTFVEWETKYGPISHMTVIDSDDRSIELCESKGFPINNYFFEKTYGRGSWTQLAVEELNLKAHLIKGEFEIIRGKLSKYL